MWLSVPRLLSAVARGDGEVNRFACLLVVVLARTVAAQDDKPTFLDVTERSRIDFRYTFGDFTYDNILESSGSGVTIFDYDGDGDLDLYLLNGTYLEGISDPKGRVFRDTPDCLYRNNGDGTFTEVGKAAGLDDRCWSMAAAPVDYDGDGDIDIFLLNYGPNRFFRNNGNGTFSDVAPEIGLVGPETLHGFTRWSVSGAFWDFDRDGDLDVMMGNFLAFDPHYLAKDAPHLMPHPSAYRGQASLLYEQAADGKFVDVTEKMQMDFPDSKCMGLTVFDYDDDGRLDLFQGNDHQLNFLFHDKGDGTFEEVGVSAGVAANDEGQPTGSMHGSIGDVDGDGHIDLLVVDLEYGALYRNLGNGLFEDITSVSGVKRAFRGKGAWARRCSITTTMATWTSSPQTGWPICWWIRIRYCWRTTGTDDFRTSGHCEVPIFARNDPRGRNRVGLRQRRRSGHHRFSHRLARDGRLAPQRRRQSKSLDRLDTGRPDPRVRPGRPGHGHVR